MSDRVRYHMDEHIPLALAYGLRRRGIDVTTAAEAGLLGAPDERHIEFALQSRRVMVTHDADFLRLHTSGIKQAGIAYCKRGARTVGQMLQALILIHKLSTSDEMFGKFIYL